MSAEPVLLADAATLRITETNLAADRAIALLPGNTASRSLTDLFDPSAAPRLQALLSQARAAGRAEDVPLRVAGSVLDVLVSASMLRYDDRSFFMLRLASGQAPQIRVPEGESRLSSFLMVAPDGLVVTSGDGSMLAANPAFLAMAELSSFSQADGEKLGRFLGRQEVELDVLIANLRMRGPVRLLQTALRGAMGSESLVEVSAAEMPGQGQPAYGFAIRDIGPRIGGSSNARGGMAAPVSNLTELVGRVPLRELVRDATDVIEKLAIEAALELSSDNRALAAEMLGLSRQSLYVKLRRFNIGGADHTEEDA
jgi:transcriptional regulator PpsR